MQQLLDDGTFILVKTIDTMENRHNSKYLSSLVNNLTTETETTCKIRSLVTDNVANMWTMCTEIECNDR